MADAKMNSPKQNAGARIAELAKLPKDEPEAPKGALSHGAIPTVAEIKALEDAAAGAKEFDHKPAQSAREALAVAKAARAALEKGAELAPEHQKTLERAEEIGKLVAASDEARKASERRTVEELGLEAGYLPQMWKSPMDMRTGRPRAVAPRCNPKHWIYAGAKAYHQWPIGKELTRAEFAAAVRAAHDHPIR